MSKLIICLITALAVLNAGVVARERPTTAHRLQVVSYNIRHGQGMDGMVDLRRIADVIAQTTPDLVVLQEVDVNCKRSGRLNIPNELGRMLNMQSRFGKFMNYQGGEYGMAVLSRLPISQTIRHPLPEGAEPRCALEVKIQVDGFPLPVSLICIHNDWTSEPIRVQQVTALLDALKERRNPTILAGDFNGEPSDASIQLLRDADWKRLDKGGQKTWPSDKPEVEIDFIMIKHFKPISVVHDVIDESLASDHRPIYATITFLTE